ncbi:hypothetical protein [Actinopolymorpha alba]|uniref:hypothetical protein n=1 Tax=Actinopolymorpha alba TaxID=533267 RepID=UPI00036E4DF6|nr:hypothetical protein [Actinopolymorpha alba]
MPNAATPIDQDLALTLTQDEVASVHALTRGLSELAGREIDPSSAVVAALDRALERLLDDFELSDSVRGEISSSFSSMRASWPRGNCCL